MDKRKKVTILVIIGAIVLLAVAAAVVYCLTKCEDKTAEEPLTTYWSENSTPAQELRDYVRKVTNPDDKANFIPERDRIAVFDMDGTLACETYYTYYDTLVATFLGGVGLDAREDGLGVVVETLCRHHSPAFFPDMLSAGLRVGRIGTTSVRYEIGLFRAGEDTPCAEGHFIHVQVEADRQDRTRPLPEKLRMALAPLLVPPAEG